MFCKKCGSEITDGSNYCSKCGEKITPKLSFGTVIVFLMLFVLGFLITMFGLFLAIAAPLVGFIIAAIGVALIIWGMYIKKRAKKKAANYDVLNNNSINTSSTYEKEKESISNITYRPLVYSYNRITPECVSELSEPNTFIAFDLETTGLNPRCDEIIQIGAIKYKNGIETERFMSYVKPTIPIPQQASRVNNIYDYTVSDAPDVESVLKNFIDFIDDYTLIAHNANFDMKFLQTHLNYNNLKLIENDVIDTLEIAKRFLTLPNYKLPTIKEHYNLDVTMHEAVADCLVCSTLYLDYLDFIKPKYDEITDDIYKCFLVGHSDEVDNWYYSFDNMCRLNGGRCYKTKAKSANYAIIISKTYQVSNTVNGYRDDGYKVTNLEDAFEYMNKALKHMSKAEKPIITEE